MPSFTHIALLGRQPELGLIELESVLGAAAIEPFGRQIALITTAPDLSRLGGVIKTAEIMYRGEATDLQALPIDIEQLPVSDSKISFALSVYGARSDARSVMAAGLQIKKILKQRGSVRLVTPTKGSEVTVAQLKHNRIIEDGFELMVVVSGKEMIIARTVAIQDIDWYSRRDYERPSRSAKVGMLPPKLAQILINTTKASVVVDPFCGTGVVPQEALLMGRTAVGSDLSAEMVAASTDNLTWLANVSPVSIGAWQVDEADARTVKLPDTVCAVVSEGYLGPNLSAQPSAVRLDEIKLELRELYLVALKNWAGQLDAGAEVALCVPAWKIGKTWSYLNLVDDTVRLGYTVKVFKHVPARILYARDDQVVGRQLLLLRKN